MSNYRKTPRADWIDYDNGMFFITICTKGHKNFFGEIFKRKMVRTEIGEILQKELENFNSHHKNIDIPLFVVMPNHLHAIITCKSDSIEDMPNIQRTPNPSHRANADMARHVPTLSRYIASMKSAVTRKAREINSEFAWQKRYHDHLIRGNNDMNKIADYIETNIENWEKDCFYEKID